jgi:hypothetical protein
MAGQRKGNRFYRRHNGPRPEGNVTWKRLHALAVIRLCEEAEILDWKPADLAFSVGVSIRRLPDILDRLERDAYIRFSGHPPFVATSEGVGFLYGQLDRRLHHFDGEFEPVFEPDRPGETRYRTPIGKVLDQIVEARRLSGELKDLGWKDLAIRDAIAFRTPSKIEEAILHVKNRKMLEEEGVFETELRNPGAYARRMIMAPVPPEARLRLYLKKIAHYLPADVVDELVRECARLGNPIQAAKRLASQLDSGSTKYDVARISSKLFAEGLIWYPPRKEGFPG